MDKSIDELTKSYNQRLNLEETQLKSDINEETDEYNCDLEETDSCKSKDKTDSELKKDFGINYPKISTRFRHTYVNNNLYIFNEFNDDNDHNIENNFFDDSVALNIQNILWKNKSRVNTTQYCGAASANNTLHISESPESNETVLIYTFNPQNNLWSLPTIVEFLTGVIDHNGRTYLLDGINVNSDIYEKLIMLNYNSIGNDFFYLDVSIALNVKILILFLEILMSILLKNANGFHPFNGIAVPLDFKPLTDINYRLLVSLSSNKSLDPSVPLPPPQTILSKSKSLSNKLIIYIAAIIISIISIGSLYKWIKKIITNSPINNSINSDEWSNWIEEAILKNHIKYYDHKNCFSNMQIIGKGHFGEVFRVNYKDSDQYLALKSFFNFDIATIKEIVHELQLQREIDFHDNVIRFHGITSSNSVLEYADGGSFRNYLKKNFNELNWNDKCNLAYQLAYAASFLYNENIIHCDLHSNNILIHQNTIKLADFGLSRRIEDVTNQKSSLYGVIPYVDPERLKNSSYKYNEKSDVYSIGVLLWEISKTPISSPDIPFDYIKLYTACWDGISDNHPDMKQVTIKLKEILKINKENNPVDNFEELDQLLNDQLSDEQGESDFTSQIINLMN
ncbi:hypothetical protein RclHR1_15000001 [Rhizophagus clarus]|uniref:Protein kinase domain-containing protein n=1 Tax=Rhizophagus clarus TaxID=94130 RepID=A0A2Z6QE49_9GLOM|nr:hypothetical protein RclHR1_15000001 [Rhizophagus clarus]